MRLNSFNINGELLEIETPTFKESPMHKASYEKYELLRDGRVESILLKALEAQKTYAVSRQEQLEERYRGFLMVSTEHSSRLANLNDFNAYLKSVCTQLALTDYKGDSVEITSHALRHSTIAEFSGNPNMPFEQIRAMSNHSSESMTMGYGYSAEPDRRKKTAPIITALHTALEGPLLPNTAIEQMTLSEKVFRKKQMDGNSRLLDADSLCSEMGCSPQYEHCIMKCNGYQPDPEYIPAVREHCAMLEKRIAALKTKGHTDLLKFNEHQLAVFKRFLERAEI